MASEPADIVASMAVVGRNDPCPCGSGRKHKRCCLGAGAAALRLADRLEDRIDELGEQVRQEHWSAWLAEFERNIGPLHRPGVVQAEDVAWLDAWLVCHAPVVEGRTYPTGSAIRWRRRRGSAGTIVKLGTRGA